VRARPTVIGLAGPNGAGKSTLAPRLLVDVLAVDEFVDADLIARGLSGFRPESAAIAAGRAMLRRLQTLADRQSTFAFETTLASRMLAPRIASMVRTGYAFHLIFLWLPSADFALERVATRVQMGGHDVRRSQYADVLFED
jgi:predicted ABC-type ATPase